WIEYLATNQVVRGSNPLGRTIQTASTSVGAVFLWAFFTLYPSRLFPLMVLQRPLPSLLQHPYSHFFLPVAPREPTASKPRCLQWFILHAWIPGYYRQMPYNPLLRGLAAIKKALSQLRVERLILKQAITLRATIMDTPAFQH
ncbi:hypothetical protein, partial [Aeromonas jandaei]